MKRKTSLCLAFLALVGTLWWWTGPRHALNGPPALTVSAGGEGTFVGFWRGDWTSPTATFVADGDLPTAPYARPRQPVVYVREGAHALTLFYPVAPSHVTVSCTPDSGGEAVSLYDGRGKRTLSIPLPEDFSGIYQVSEQWRTVPPASGSAGRGFLVVGEGEPVGDPRLEDPPVLTVAKPDGTRVTAALGSYFWCVWLGGEKMEHTIADAPHPLDFLDPPPVSALPGDWLELQFSFPPDHLRIRSWRAGDGTDQGPAEVDTLSGYDLLVPQGGDGTVYEVMGSWYLAGDTQCEVSYLFSVPSG